MDRVVRVGVMQEEEYLGSGGGKLGSGVECVWPMG